MNSENIVVEVDQTKIDKALLIQKIDNDKKKKINYAKKYYQLNKKKIKKNVINHYYKNRQIKLDYAKKKRDEMIEIRKDFKTLTKFESLMKQMDDLKESLEKYKENEKMI